MSRHGVGNWPDVKGRASAWQPAVKEHMKCQHFTSHELLSSFEYGEQVSQIWFTVHVKGGKKEGEEVDILR